MIPRHSFLFAVVLLLPIFAIAQSKYQPGYIVTPQGDTVKGTLYYRDWDSNPKSINFKRSTSSTIEKLGAEKVIFFSAEVGHLAEYKGYIGPVSMDNTDINHLANSRDTSFSIDTIFLRVLQDGNKIKLFSYTDSKKTRYFIASNFSEQPVELTYRLYNNFDKSNPTTYETGFKGQLYDAAVKAGAMTPALKNQISAANYTGDDLAGITATINNISAKDVAKNNAHKLKTSSKILIAIGIVAVLVWVIHDFASVNHH